MNKMTKYYYVTINDDESVLSTGDLSCLERFFQKYENSWSGDDYPDVLMENCKNRPLRRALSTVRELFRILGIAPITDASLLDEVNNLQLDIEEEILDVISKDYESLSNLCMDSVHEWMNGHNIGYSSDWISYPFTAEEVARFVKEGYNTIVRARYPLVADIDADDIARLWSNGVLPDDLVKDLRSNGLELDDNNGKILSHD